jgi:hypothetical protein
MPAVDAEVFESMDEADQLRTATRYWTCAEAVSKAVGRGLPLMLARGMRLGFDGRGEWNGLRFAVVDTKDGLTAALASDDLVDLEAVLEEPTLLDPDQPA